MDFTTLERRLDKLFTEAIAAGVFPGAVVGLIYGRRTAAVRKIFSYGALAYGIEQRRPMHRKVHFDLASLTKPLATVLAILCLVKAKKIGFADQLDTLLGQEVPPALKRVTLAHLLGHSSGLAAHRPYFRPLKNMPASARLQQVRQWILAEIPENAPGARIVYSDLGYILLSWIVEMQSGTGFERFVSEKVLAPLGVEQDIFFNRDNQPAPVVYAPTEDCPWRGKILTGQVHDDNCFAMGGVSGHAGLFGNMDGVLTMAAHLLEIVNGAKAHPFYSSADLQQITAPQSSATTWGLGFDTPSPTGSSAGRFLSEKSFGHLGFTGTSMWVDPVANIAIVLLSNRVHPHRDNDLIKKFRPLFHDTIMQAFKW